jgi:hypothetical protein
VFGRTATRALPRHVIERAEKAWAAAAASAFLRGEPAGLEPVGLHEARHACASVTIAPGVTDRSGRKCHRIREQERAREVFGDQRLGRGVRASASRR